MDAADRRFLAEDRSRFCWWLAEFLLEPAPIGPGETEAGVDGGDDALATAWLELVRVAGAIDGPLRMRLAVEHARLMGGLSDAGLPPPFESSWRPGQQVAGATSAVVREYAAAGFADIDVAAGPQDHLAVELKYLALLALREAEAWRRGDRADADLRLRQQRHFVAEHLAAWVPDWVQAVGRATREPVFRALAQLVGASVARAAQDLASAEAAAMA